MLSFVSLSIEMLSARRAAALARQDVGVLVQSVLVAKAERLEHEYS